jgi:hypothetical protein
MALQKIVSGFFQLESASQDRQDGAVFLTAQLLFQFDQLFEFEYPD